MSNTNRYLVEQAAVIENPLTFAVAAGDMTDVQANIQLLIDLISLEGANPEVKRANLDEMSPQARIALFKILTDLKAASTAA
jgi:hypothetical protein